MDGRMDRQTDGRTEDGMQHLIRPHRDGRIIIIYWLINDCIIVWTYVHVDLRHCVVAVLVNEALRSPFKLIDIH